MVKTFESVFTEIYSNNLFQGLTSKSGRGSDPDQTRKLVIELPNLLKKYSIKSIIDIPCGDMAWMPEVLGQVPVDYLGLDIVTSIIDLNKTKYGNPTTKFKKLDIVTDKFDYSADLIICRDLLVHLCFKDALIVLDKFCKSNSKFLLATTFLNLEVNSCDLPEITQWRTVHWRPLNLEKSPFNLGKMRESLLEGCPERDSNRNYSDKALGLWEL